MQLVVNSLQAIAVLVVDQTIQCTCDLVVAAIGRNDKRLFIEAWAYVIITVEQSEGLSACLSIWAFKTEFSVAYLQC